MDVIGIRRHAGNQRRDAEAVEIRPGQKLDPREQIVADLDDRIVTDLGSHSVRDYIKDPGAGGQEKHDHAPPCQNTVILKRNDFVYNMRKDPRESQIHECSEDLDKKSEDHTGDIRLEISGNRLHKRYLPFFHKISY